MLSGIYMEGRSLFHNLDPRAKLLWALLVLAASIAAQFNGLKSLPVFISTLIALSLSGIGAGLAALLVFNASVFLLVTTLVWAGMYASQGTPLVTIGFFRITDVGLLVASGKFFLIVNPILAFVVFFTTTKPYHISWTLEKMGVPSKLAFSFVIALSLLPGVVRAVRDVTDVQKLRGLSLDKGSLLERLRKHVPVIVPVISRLLSDVWDLSMVLASRCFGVSRKRSYVEEPRWTRRDTVFVLISAAFYLGVVAWAMRP
ncbi:MAG: energy-coupling factor transporter transmembrane component T family protein [Thermofilaceae archaeon]